MPERLIDADALKNDIDTDMIYGLCVWFKKIVDRQPTIEAEPVRHGRWIPVDGEPYAKCSYCGEKHYGCTTPYCDMCGAYMRATDTNVGGKGGADNDKT